VRTNAQTGRPAVTIEGAATGTAPDGGIALAAGRTVELAIPFTLVDAGQGALVAFTLAAGNERSVVQVPGVVTVGVP
jgi:hypothetical protein